MAIRAQCGGPQAGELKTWETETHKGRIQSFRFPASQLPLRFSARRSSSQKLRSGIAHPGEARRSRRQVTGKQGRQTRTADTDPSQRPTPCPLAYGVAYNRHNSNNCGSMSSRSGTRRQFASPASLRQNVRSKYPLRAMQNSHIPEVKRSSGKRWPSKQTMGEKVSSASMLSPGQKTTKFAKSARVHSTYSFDKSSRASSSPVVTATDTGTSISRSVRRWAVTTMSTLAVCYSGSGALSWATSANEPSAIVATPASKFEIRNIMILLSQPLLRSLSPSLSRTDLLVSRRADLVVSKMQEALVV